jgi:quercetin dioxygenase-like cupin family protein
MSVRTWSVLLFVSCYLPVSLVAQGASGMTLAALKTSKFVNLPGLPTCMTVAVQRGDPSKESAALLIKFAPGCTVPWHWHSAGEQLLLVSGSGTAEMKEGKPGAMHAGDYAYLPAKSVHQFKAVTAALLLDIPDAAFDIHYVDKDGQELSPEQALKPAARKAIPAKSSSKQ